MRYYKKSFTLRIDEDLLERIRHISKVNRRSLNSQLEHLIEQSINQFESENGKIDFKIK